MANPRGNNPTGTLKYCPGRWCNNAQGYNAKIQRGQDSCQACKTPIEERRRRLLARKHSLLTPKLRAVWIMDILHGLHCGVIEIHKAKALFAMILSAMRTDGKVSRRIGPKAAQHIQYLLDLGGIRVSILSIGRTLRLEQNSTRGMLLDWQECELLPHALCSSCELCECGCGVKEWRDVHEANRGKIQTYESYSVFH